jgi:Putative beta-barrel porin-2, OmpL-like. bbp2
MKFNKWTLGLAAVGVVSLASAARADEKMSSLQTALSNTTISGYVSASFNWAVYPGNYQDSPAGYIPFQGINKENGFNLDVVKLSISKPQDESPWASGYQVDLLFGPDAVGYNTSANAYSGYSDFAIKQAYVSLRTPIGNGIDWKIGVFDSPLGYEVFDAGSNPNYTRSWGRFQRASPTPRWRVSISALGTINLVPAKLHATGTRPT